VRRLPVILAVVVLAAAAVLLVLSRREPDGSDSRAALERELLERQLRSAEALLASARTGPLLRFDDLLVTVDEEVVQDLLTASLPVERTIEEYRIRLTSARVRFRDGLALVVLAGRATLAGRAEETAYADLNVHGVLDVVGIDPASGVLRAQVSVIGIDVPQVNVLGLAAPVRALVRDLAAEPLEEFAELASGLEIPVAVDPEIEIPAIEDDDVRIAAATLPLHVALRSVETAAGKLWVTIGVEAVAPDDGDSGSVRPQADARGPDGHAHARPAALPASSARPHPSVGPAVLHAAVPTALVPRAAPVPGPSGEGPSADSTTASLLDRDPTRPDSSDGPGMAALRRRYAAVRDSLDTFVRGDTLLSRLAADTIGVAVGFRPELVNRLLARAAAEYLDRVELTLELEEEEDEAEDLEVELPIGDVEVGDYYVQVTIHRIQGVLAAGTPRVSFAAGNRLDLVVPARIVSGRGNATLDFTWDPEGPVDLLCDDFHARLSVSGGVVPRAYEVHGAFLLSSVEERIVVQPQFPKQKVRIAVAPSERTWAQVRRTLADLDDLEQCGIGLEIVSARKIEGLLREVVARGFKVKVPTKLIPVLDLPAGITEEVEVGARRLRIEATPRDLRITPRALWYAAAVRPGRASEEEVGPGLRPPGAD
jgi:hypothetical protein